MTNWVRTEEKLSNVGEEVLVYTKDKIYGIGAYSDTYQCYFVSGYSVENVEYWKPLPEAPNVIKERKTTTNYDRIKSMSVEEMAAFIVKIKLIFSEDICNNIQEQIKDYVIKIGHKKIPKWKKKERKFYERWLLQEVSEDE